MRVVIPTLIYGSETWLNAQARRQTEVFAIMCLRKICSIRRIIRVRNSYKREVRV